jgi:molybdopterin-guanine dinucleotide biosynthesis protein
MKLVVVGGQGRKVGKTSVITGLIRRLNTLAWTAVKICHHAAGAERLFRRGHP